MKTFWEKKMDVQKLLESDPELGRFIAEQEQNSRLKKVAEKLTNECWDLCVSNPNQSRIDSKTEACLVNCVDRFIDTSTFVMQAFASKGQAMAASHGGFDDSSSSLSAPSSSSSAFGDSGLILEDKLKSGGEEAKTKSGWKFW